MRTALLILALVAAFAFALARPAKASPEAFGLKTTEGRYVKVCMTGYSTFDGFPWKYVVYDTMWPGEYSR